MKTIISSLTILVLAVLFFVSGCTKDKPFTGQDSEISIFGYVMDENGDGVPGATASAYGVTTTTDANGLFRLNHVRVDVDVKHATVRVNKTGYFEGSRTFTASTEVVNRIEIRLIPKALKGTFVAASGANVIISSNAGVTFPANAIRKADGSLYSGTVNVYAAYLNPSDNNLSTKMPGDLIGIASDNSENLLRTYGMVNVVLEDPSGNPLNIAAGSQATISMKVPHNLLSSAPATIPLWYFDAETGLWKEEGVATLSGNTYTGSVNHFSWWNCDTPLASIKLKIKFVDDEGNPLPDIYTTLVNISNSDERLGISSSDGVTEGLVYANEVLQLSFFDACGNWQVIGNIGPFSTDTDLGSITINAGEEAIYSGRITDCSGNGVVDGYIKYYLGSIYYYLPADASGNFSFTILPCNNPNLSISLSAFDPGNMFEGNIQTINVEEGVHNLGDISTCISAIHEYIQFQLDGSALQVATEISSLMDDDSGFVSGYNPQTGNWIDWRWAEPVNGEGSFAITDLSFYLNGVYYFSANSTGLNMVITSFPPVGGYIEGTINGTYIDHMNVTHTINCIFRIKRW